MLISRKVISCVIFLAIACGFTYCQKINPEDVFTKKRQCGPKDEVSVFLETIKGIKDAEERTLSISSVIKISKDLPSDTIAKVY